ncbi:hypothetical protein CHCC15337_0469 [Bacillus paralicheniformis]|nr:hypothetical protein CHCC5023_3869 [Bacillus paralicheniformis]TWJ79290.1 hypothetical protein CHCC5019_0253 [Bacillus paralicheniformis]TWL38413.1 hypothetical protein CHCC15337_0469 [Bacillus paralicheniformis]TWN36788.1 hypothetical protein CHCC14527_0205 [Bacillus paralicheniformis]TWN61776.1 hypothetical protein CHCC14427_4165 [Bacillus paralicheniformis]
MKNMNYYPKTYIKKEADKGFTTRKNNCKIGTKNILPEYKKRIKNFLRNFDIFVSREILVSNY